IALLGLIVSLGEANPSNLIFFLFLGGTAAALISPSWQSIVPILVPRRDLQAAISLNSIAVNISRAIGPALAGFLIGIAGLAAPFWANALTTAGIVAALLWWHPEQSTSQTLPPERFASALIVGWRHARYNPQLRASLIRASGFF